MPGERVPIAIPIVTIAIGAVMILLALARPAFFWELGRVRAGRDWIGDTGMTIAFVVLGAVLAGLGTVLATKK